MRRCIMQGEALFLSLFILSQDDNHHRIAIMTSTVGVLSEAHFPLFFHTACTFYRRTLRVKIEIGDILIKPRVGNEETRSALFRLNLIVIICAEVLCTPLPFLCTLRRKSSRRESNRVRVYFQGYKRPRAQHTRLYEIVHRIGCILTRNAISSAHFRASPNKIHGESWRFLCSGAALVLIAGDSRVVGAGSRR